MFLYGWSIFRVKVLVIDIMFLSNGIFRSQSRRRLYELPFIEWLIKPLTLYETKVVRSPSVGASISTYFLSQPFPE